MHNQLAEQFLHMYNQGLFFISHIVRYSPLISVPKENLPSLNRFIQNSKELFNCSDHQILKENKNKRCITDWKGFIKDTSCRI